MYRLADCRIEQCMCVCVCVCMCVPCVRRSKPDHGDDNRAGTRCSKHMIGALYPHAIA